MESGLDVGGMDVTVPFFVVAAATAVIGEGHNFQPRNSVRAFSETRKQGPKGEARDMLISTSWIHRVGGVCWCENVIRGRMAPADSRSSIFVHNTSSTAQRPFFVLMLHAPMFARFQ